MHWMQCAYDNSKPASACATKRFKQTRSCKTMVPETKEALSCTFYFAAESHWIREKMEQTCRMCAGRAYARSLACTLACCTTHTALSRVSYKFPSLPLPLFGDCIFAHALHSSARFLWPNWAQCYPSMYIHSRGRCLCFCSPFTRHHQA
jgi:hypothetical protein